jgi:pseudomonalisin
VRTLAGVVTISALAATAATASAAGLGRAPLGAIPMSGFANTKTQAFPLFKGTTDLGALPASTAMHVAVGLTMRNKTAINGLLRAQVTPGNALYEHYLTPAQTASMFGPTGASVQAVASYLTSAGFKNVAVTPDNMIVTADGTAAIAAKAFNTKLDVLSVGGKHIYANVKAAQVPTALASTVTAIEGLNNLPMHLNMRYRNGGARQALAVGRPAPGATTSPCTSVPGVGCVLNEFSATGFQLAYDSPQDGGNTNVWGYTGKSTNIAIFAEGHIQNVLTDLVDAENANVPPLPHVKVNVVYAGIPSPDVSGQDEFDLDTQSSTGIAGNVKSLYLYVATSLTDSDTSVEFDRFKTDDKATAGSASFGECEIFPELDGALTLDDTIFAQAAVQGQTVFSSAGDNGTTCPVVAATGVPGTGLPFQSYPGTSPYVVSVGGTTLVTNTNGSYNAEISWIGGGGGNSTEEPSPFWQQGVVPAIDNPPAGVPGVETFKAVPDVAMDADPNTGASVVVNGVAEEVGGTSLSSPLSLGVWARLETYHGNKLGFASPLFYQEYKNATTLSAVGIYTPPVPPAGALDQFIGGFHDVIAGSNGLPALPGYDYTTGLGTFDITRQFKDLPTSYPS